MRFGHSCVSFYPSFICVVYLSFIFVFVPAEKDTCGGKIKRHASLVRDLPIFRALQFASHGWGTVEAHICGFAMFFEYILHSISDVFALRLTTDTASISPNFAISPLPGRPRNCFL